MHGRSATWFPLLLLALLAALSFWADRTVQPFGQKHDGNARHDPDYKMSNFDTLKTGADGIPQYTLAATEMVHFPDDDSTHLVRPRFTQYVASKPYTQIEGQRGLVTSNGDDVYFMDNVKVVRFPTGQRTEMTLLTDYLHLNPDTEVATTDRPVSILQAPRTVVHAIGMEYDKKHGILKLLKNVRVHYERPDSKLPALKQPPALVKPTAGKKPNSKTASTSKAKVGTPKTRIRRHYEKPASQL